MANGVHLERRPAPTLDIVIPVYNEGRNILKVLAALQASVSVPCRILICYDFEEDDTLAAIRDNWRGTLDIAFVRNTGRGAHGAVLSGFAASTAQDRRTYFGSFRCRVSAWFTGRSRLLDARSGKDRQVSGS